VGVLLNKVSINLFLKIATIIVTNAKATIGLKHVEQLELIVALSVRVKAALFIPYFIFSLFMFVGKFRRESFRIQVTS